MADDADLLFAEVSAQRRKDHADRVATRQRQRAELAQARQHGLRARLAARLRRQREGDDGATLSVT